MATPPGAARLKGDVMLERVEKVWQPEGCLADHFANEDTIRSGSRSNGILCRMLQEQLAALKALHA